MDETLKELVNKKFSGVTFSAEELSAAIEGIVQLEKKDSKTLFVRAHLLSVLNQLFDNCFKFINIDNIDKVWSVAYKLSAIRGSCASFRL
jgi:hypothetical protein